MAPREMTEEPTVENLKKDLNVTFLKLVMSKHAKYIFTGTNLPRGG